MTFNLSQAAQLLAMFGGDDSLICVEHRQDGHEGHGLYAYHEEYPEEGSMLLDSSKTTRGSVAACRVAHDSIWKGE